MKIIVKSFLLVFAGCLEVSIQPQTPNVLSTSPSLGDMLGGAKLTLRGQYIENVTAVLIGGEPCTDLQLNAQQATCTTPPLQPGRWDVTVSFGEEQKILPAAWEAWSPSLIPGARVFSSSSGVELSDELQLNDHWQQVAQSSPWHPRDGAGLLWFQERLWLLGGWDGFPVDEWHGQLTTNEVWASDDLGATWQQILADEPSPPQSGPGARWIPRHTAGWLAYTYQTTPYLYVIGGDIYHPTSDVWRSADGFAWELVTDTSPWAGRVLHMVGVYQGDLYVMGGQLDINDPSTALRDVWRSRDGGLTWEQLEDAPWAPRGMTYNLVEFQGKLWLCGGGTYDDEPRTYYNDVWSFDGATWTEESTNGVAPWEGREYHNVFVADERLWVASGYKSDDLNHNDIWYSEDGTHWTSAPTPLFMPGHADGVAVTPLGVIHASGNAMDSYVFRMVQETSALVGSWLDLGSSQLRVDAPLLDARPRFIPSAFDGIGGVLFDGTGALLRLPTPDPQPDGRSVFWVGQTGRSAPAVDSFNASMTVVGDSTGSCRHQAGYSEDQMQLVVTDSLGDWSNGNIVRGQNIADQTPRLLGFTHHPNGEVSIYINGERQGEIETHEYDSPFMAWDSLGAGFSSDNKAQVLLGLVVILPGVIASEDLARLTVFSQKWIPNN